MKFTIGQTVTFAHGETWCSEDIDGTRGVIEDVREYSADAVPGGAVYGVRRLTVRGVPFGALVWEDGDALHLG